MKNKIQLSENTLMFSIICPIYNSEKYLKECVESVINQTFKHWELLLIDDGSSDSSAAIADKFSKQDTRIKSFHKKNEGQYIAREYGLKKSSGKYILFLDSDDFYEPNALEILSKIISQSKTDMILFGLYKFKENKFKKPMHPDGLLNLSGNNKKEVLSLCFTKPTSNISLCAYCFKKNLFSKVQNPPIRKTIRSHEDVLLLYQITKNSNNIITLGDCLYNYRDNQQSVTHNLHPSDYLDAINVSDYIFSSLEKEHEIKRADISKRIIQRLSWLPMSYILMCYKNHPLSDAVSETKLIRKKYIYKNFTKHYVFETKICRLVSVLFRLRLNKINQIIIKKYYKN